MLQSPHSSRHSISSHLGRYYHLGTILPRNEPENRRDISRYVVPPDAAAFTPSSCPNRFLSHGWDEPHPLFPFPLFTLLVHRCVPIAYTGVNCRDRHLCFRTRLRSGRGTSAAFCNHGRRSVPRSNIRWPTSHSEEAATGGAHGSRWERYPPRQLIGEPFAESHLRRMGNGTRQNCRAPLLGYLLTSIE